MLGGTHFVGQSAGPLQTSANRTLPQRPTFTWGYSVRSPPVTETSNARFLVLKWVQRWHGPSSSLHQLWVPVAGARSRIQARCSPPPTSTPKIGHHDFLPHKNEPPTSLHTLRTACAAIVLSTWKGGYSIPLACTGLTAV